MEQTQPNIRVLCLGDVVASSGIAALRRGLKDLRQTVNADFVIINGENATGGLGIDSNTLKEVWKYGADVVTLGDHAWAKKDLKDFLSKEESTRCLRPANFPGDGPGRGFGIYTLDNNLKICVINL